MISTAIIYKKTQLYNITLYKDMSLSPFTPEFFFFFQRKSMKIKRKFEL